MKSVTVKIRIASANDIDNPMSEVQRQTVRQAGAIRRISVAVLVDGITRTGDNGEPVWEPRPAEEIDSLRDLVVAAIGFDEARGDIVTVESMAFQPDATPGELVEQSPWVRLIERNAMTVIQIGILGLVAVVLGLAVVRPILTRPAPPLAVTPALSGPAPDAPTAAGAQAGTARLAAPDGDTADASPAPDGETLRLAVTENPEQTASMLQEWLAPDTRPESAEEAA